MKKIPENHSDVKGLLYEQLALLAEKSEECDVEQLRQNIEIIIKALGC